MHSCGNAMKDMWKEHDVDGDVTLLEYKGNTICDHCHVMEILAFGHNSDAKNALVMNAPRSVSLFKLKRRN